MPLEHPDQTYCSIWDWEAKAPVVDGKYEDPKTGEICTATGPGYSGPPAVDIIIMSLHEDTNHYTSRAARPFPVATLLHQIVQVIHDRKLEIDSLTATPYAIRVVLAHELKVEEFTEVSDLMTNGIWEQT